MFPISIGLLVGVVITYGIGLNWTVSVGVLLLCLTMSWFAVATAVVPEFFFRRRNELLDIFSPKYIFLAFFLVYIYIPLAVICGQDGYAPHLRYYVGQSNILLAITIVSIVGVSFGFGFNLHRRRVKEIRLRGFLLNEKLINRLVVLLLIIGLCSRIYYLSIFGFNIQRIFELLSSTERGDNLQEISQLLLIGGSCFDAGVLLWVFKIICGKDSKFKKYLKISIIIVPAIIVSFFLSSKRSNVVVLVLFPIIWFHYSGYFINFKKGILISLLSAIFIPVLLLARIAIPLLQAGLDPADYLGDSLQELSIFYIELPEFNLADMILLAVAETEKVELHLGNKFESFFKYTFGTLIIFIPRVIWPEKPLYEDFSYVFFELVEGVSGARVGYAPTIVASYYIFFGIFGLFLASFATGFVYNKIYLKMTQKCDPKFIFLYSLLYWAMFLYLRFGTTAFLILLFLQNFLVLILVGCFFVRRRQVYTGA